MLSRHGKTSCSVIIDKNLRASLDPFNSSYLVTFDT